jgi:hypothetical protein
MCVENNLSRKSKPHYLGPMIVVRRTCNGAYLLAELTGAVAKLPYAAFHLIPYYPRSCTSIDVTAVVDPADVAVEVGGDEGYFRRNKNILSYLLYGIYR